MRHLRSLPQITIMPGSSIITAVCCLFNHQNIDESKKRTITYDAELYLGLDDNGNDQVIIALLHYYTEQPEPQDNKFYFISGKASSICSNTIVGKDFNDKDYDLEIEAFIVGFTTTCIIPCLHLS